MSQGEDMSDYQQQQKRKERFIFITAYENREGRWDACIHDSHQPQVM